ncbi:MAG TPA: NrfD/PsrC family molybdoenzyme membrane anchor subunit [Terriglobales bacterium]|nr:NrfD/PsrC family molybdoenzyme membrane anchor subunit [Terriglobales bacterium]
MSRLLKQITLWRLITAVIIGAGLYGSYVRFFIGWQASTHLSDAQPWGVWVGVGTLCGVALSAGGFAIAAAVYILGMERYRPVVKASVLISFLGYSTVCVGYLYELGLPWNMWHIFIYWNRHSVLFEVAGCVIMYTTVLTLEFAPNVIEKLPWVRFREMLLHYHHKIVIGLTLIGTVLSSLHQSFLGGLFLVMKDKIHPLWYSQYIHTMFYMSAIPAGLAVVIMVMYLSMRSLGVKLDYTILTDLAKVIVPMLYIYGIFRFVDLVNNGGAHFLFRRNSEAGYFWMEILMMVVLPIIGFSLERVRNTPKALYWTAAVLVMGVIANRVNVSITSLEWFTHANYVPSWIEMAMMAMCFACAVIVFRLCVLYLDIFPRAEKRERWLSTPATA